MTMTIVERLLTAVNCREPDKVPVSFNFKPVYVRQWARDQRRSMGEDVASRIKAELDFFRQWPEVVPSLNGPPGTGAVGLLGWLDKKSLPADTPPPSQHWEIATVRQRLREAQVLDPHRDAWMPAALEIWQSYINLLPPEAREQYGSLVYTLGIPGPVGSVGTLLSYPETFRLLHEDQDFLEQLLEFHTSSAVLWVKAVEEVFARSGLKPCRLFIAEEMLPMVSPARARELCLPYLKRIYDSSQAAIKVFHCDNRITHMPGVVCGLGANVFAGNFSDYSVLKEAFGGKMALMGNVPSLYLLTEGSPQDVEETSRWLISRCGPGGGFILSSGGGFDPSGKTPLENVTAMVQAAQKYGAYPIPAKAEAAPQKYRSVMAAHFSSEPVASRRPDKGTLGIIAEQTCLGNPAKVQEGVQRALTAGIDAQRIFSEGLCRGLVMATDRFYEAQYFYPEMDLAGEAYQAGLAALDGLFQPEYYRGTVVIGSMKGSYQETGIRGIQVMLQGVGLKVINLGMGIAPDSFITEAIANKAHIIALGVYFYTHVALAEEVATLLKLRGLTIKTMAGGMGITPEMATKIGVDAYAADGHQAQRKALSLLGIEA